MAREHAPGAGSAGASLRQGVFFPIGKHALWHPELLKEVAAAGHTIGGHTWSHANLAK